MDLSIIIPCYQEEASVPEQIRRLIALQRQMNDLEIIFVDGGSGDRTCSILEDAGFLWIESELGRAAQMNRGAHIATGRYLLFLHCDSYLPDNFSRIWAKIRAAQPQWGFFHVRLSGRQKVYRIIEWFINRRSTMTSVATGDQALFLRRDVWLDVGGFESIPIMEDVALSKRLRRRATPHKERARVQTSSRRWEDNGWLKTVLLMWFMRGAYFLGASPFKLARFYSRHKS